MTDKQIDGLYAEVTEAIFQTELAKARVHVAYSHVSELEEHIANRLSNKKAGGKIARQGAVSAAFEAQENERALKLIDKYCNEPNATEQFIEKLKKLKHKYMTKEEI